MKTKHDFLMVRWPDEDSVNFYLLNGEPSGTLVHLAPFHGPVAELHSKEPVPCMDFNVLSDKKFYLEADAYSQGSTSKTTYLKMVQIMVDSVQKGRLKKAVASRMEKLERTIDPVRTFEKLLEQHEGYCYLLNSSIHGVWMGASPELLLQWDKPTIESVSLAGTRGLNDLNSWTTKEDKEQSVVTDYVKKCMMESGVTHVQASGRKTKTAGNLNHLFTEVRGRTEESSVAVQALNKLHPTPALGGTPPNEALLLIQNLEDYSRKLYGGYIGVQRTDYLHCFVNIRCMKVEDGQVILFAGAGINADSNPEAEWKETEAKLQTMRSLL